MQLRPSAVQRAGPSQHDALLAAAAPGCHTAAKGETCYKHVTWAMEHGLALNPATYPGLHLGSSFTDFQAFFHGNPEMAFADCPRPCLGGHEPPPPPPPPPPPTTAVPSSHDALLAAPAPSCHTAAQGETCHEHVTWAMEHGLTLNPAGYPGLHPGSSFADFQAFFHENPEMAFAECPRPCLGGHAPPPPPTTALPPAVPRPPPVQGQGYQWVEQAGARIPVGGKVRVYNIGSSNVMWQTWPDQVHALLLGLGYSVPSVQYKVATAVHPSKSPTCDNALDFVDLETPRVGRVGWSSWGFAYDSKTDCLASPYEGALGELGFRVIAGHQVSCINSWACNPAGQTEHTLVRPSEVGEDVRDVDVVVLSNWINDSKQMWGGFRCYKGERVEFVDTTAISIENLRRLIRAIHAANPQAMVLIMANYPDAQGTQVLAGTLDRVAMINEQVKLHVQEPNTLFVNFSFPTGEDVYQAMSPGHPNCRGDRVMATRVVEALYNAKVLARGLALPVGEEGSACLATASCASLTKPCCQRSALCRLGSDGTCMPYGAGRQ